MKQQCQQGPQNRPRPQRRQSKRRQQWQQWLWRPHPIAATLFLVSLFSGFIPLAAQARGFVVLDEGGQALTSFSGSYALVIGESSYANGWQPLPGVKEDVPAVKALLEEQGFAVEVLEDPGSRELKEGITRFFDTHGYDRDVRLLLYYAGHGHTLKLDDTRDMGYIVPVDAPSPSADERGFKRLAVPMQEFDAWAKKIESRHVLFVFDSCFSGSIFATSRAFPGVIDYKIANPVRQFISSGGAQETVPDVSIFRRQFEAALRDGAADYNKDGYVSGSELGDFLQTTVVNYSGNSQHPQYGKIRDPNLDKGDFVFEVPQGRAVVRREGEAPGGPGGSRVFDNFVFIKGGEFTMGSPPGEAGRDIDEVRHQVRLNDFYMGIYEVTQKEYSELMGENHSEFKGDDFPMENVTWFEALEYCNRRSWEEGLVPAYQILDTGVVWNQGANGYRLPTEAEWEYACRAGTSGPFGVEEAGPGTPGRFNSRDFSGPPSAPSEYTNGATTPVGTFPPNNWGLYDMHGNVWEWCWDNYAPYREGNQTSPQGPASGSWKVTRGGSWNDQERNIRSAYRGMQLPNRWDSTLGFRLVRPAQ